MPYINKQSKRGIEDGWNPDEAGQLNYVITQLCLTYLKTKGERYQTYNDITGALENAKLEMYRRKVTPYEIQKCTENGDVY